ncbi:CU044_5270 family protein [Micromonospora sp. DT227]|uniref:CU044_5270 family protein n=1 Tax=Micromonospora sp. DT227 TaxID=3393433 RepID=UPI003CF90495
MNEQRMIEEVRTLLDPVAPPPGLRRQVTSTIAAAAQGPIRSLWARHWRIATVGATAAAGALALVVGQVVSIGGQPPATSAQAAEILHHAAESALSNGERVPRADQFVFTETKTLVPVVGQAQPRNEISRSWRSIDGTRDGLLWFSAPKEGGRQTVVVPGCRDGRAAQWTSDGGLRTDETQPCIPSPAYLPGLPGNAGDMLTHLKKMSGNTNPGPDEMFGNIGNLIRSGYLPPRARAALYEAAAKIPGVVASVGLTDAAGRTGAAVSLSGELARYDLLFEPKTYEFLGWQVQSTPAAPAEQVRREVVLNVVVVDRSGQLP